MFSSSFIVEDEYAKKKMSTTANPAFEIQSLLDSKTRSEAQHNSISAGIPMMCGGDLLGGGPACIQTHS